MVRTLTLIVILVMAVHIIRPLGLPGLRRRADAWKLAVAALAMIMLVAVAKGG